MKIAATALLTLALVAGAGTTTVDAAPVPAAPAVAAVATAAPASVASLTRKVTLKDGTAKAVKLRTSAATVADLLTERGLTLGEFDYVKPALTVKLKKGLRVKIYRVTVTTSTVTEAVRFDVVKQKNPDLARGKKNILVAGVDGSAERTYQITTINSKVSKKQLLAETVLLAPVTQVVEVGTKGKALNLARLKMWNRIAKCESGGRWHINTGNGYYGGLQFSLATWRSVGGRDFASRPHKASKAEQITVANRLYAKRGTRPWGCA
ncbi:MAG TPA: transglycosylase family protein [Propionicimonas sp.]|nr:transglycosylase family protein [Propionicimonas sp.]